MSTFHSATVQYLASGSNLQVFVFYFSLRVFPWFDDLTDGKLPAIGEDDKVPVLALMDSIGWIGLFSK